LYLLARNQEFSHFEYLYIPPHTFKYLHIPSHTFTYKKPVFDLVRNVSHVHHQTQEISNKCTPSGPLQ
jgi:hypothetical protein